MTQFSYKTKHQSSPVFFYEQGLSLSKNFDLEGTSAHPVSADKAWEIFEPFLKKTGVTRISEITNLDRIGIPVYNVLRPSLNSYTAAHGKGFTANASKLSAAGESLERWYAVTAEIKSFRATWNELSKTYPMIPLKDLALTPHSLFHEDLEIAWTLSWDLVNQEEVPVPLELVRLSPGGSEAKLMDLSEGLLFQCSSNGLACGVHFLEAVSQALLEVIERDSVTCSTFMSRAMGDSSPVFRAADLKTIPFPRVQELLNRISEKNIEIILADNSTDVGIPTWNCFLIDMHDKFYAGTTHGMGSSLEHETAMIRAITEAVQARSIFFSGVRDIVTSKEFYGFLREDPKNTQKLMKSGIKEEQNLSYLKDNPNNTFEEDVNYCIDRLKDVGIERVLALCLSKEEDPVSVAKIIVPGTEGYIFPYYRPGDRCIRSIKKGLEKGSPLYREEDFAW